MKHTLFFLLLFASAFVMTFCLTTCAQGKTMPSGKFISYHFTRGGGMNPFDVTVYHLRYDEETGKKLLTISGDCEGEEITVEVGDEVFVHCLELVKKNKLYRSKGYYKPMFEVLDAPSSHFSVTFTEPYGSIDGSGDMPDFVWKGLSEIHQYLKSIVGDRKAEGHVDRIYGAEGIAGMHWTDGVVTVTTPEDSEMPLKRAARGVGDDNDSQLREMGFSRYHDGDQHYFLIHDNQLDKCRLFYSFDGNESTREQMVKHDLETMRNGIHTDSIGKTVWPVVNERFLSHPMIDALTTEQLEEMLNSIKVRRYSPNGGLEWYTDIGEVNREMLSNEIKSRKKDTEH